jgi:hypothetical protein
MRAFFKMIIKDIKLFFVGGNFIYLVALILVFSYISNNYNFEANKSIIYCYIQPSDMRTAFIENQIDEEKSVVLLDSEEKVKQYTRINPFSYGMIIDFSNDEINVILRGHESEMAKSNIEILSAYLLFNDVDISDAYVTYVKDSDEKKLQKEKQIIPLFMFILITIVPFFLTLFTLLKEKKVISDSQVLKSNLKQILLSKIVTVSTFCITATYVFLKIMTQSNSDDLYIAIVLTTSCLVFSSLGCLISSFFESFYRSLVAIFIIAITIFLPIIQQVLNVSNSITDFSLANMINIALRQMILYSETSTSVIRLTSYALFLLVFFYTISCYRYKKNAQQGVLL